MNYNYIAGTTFIPDIIRVYGWKDKDRIDNFIYNENIKATIIYEPRTLETKYFFTSYEDYHRVMVHLNPYIQVDNYEYTEYNFENENKQAFLDAAHDYGFV